MGPLKKVIVFPSLLRFPALLICFSFVGEFLILSVFKIPEMLAAKEMNPIIIFLWIIFLSIVFQNFAVRLITIPILLRVSNEELYSCLFVYKLKKFSKSEIRGYSLSEMVLYKLNLKFKSVILYLSDGTIIELNAFNLSNTKKLLDYLKQEKIAFLGDDNIRDNWNPFRLRKYKFKK